MIREVDLLGYLPPFVAEYKEIQAIEESLNPEFQLLADSTEELLNASLICYAGEKGIARYEDMLGIKPLPTDDLETRRTRILIKWNSDIPYTYKVLIRKLIAFCGEDGFTCIPNFKEKYELEIITHMPETSQIPMIEEFLEDVVPQNIIYYFSNSANIEADASVYVAGAAMNNYTFDIPTREFEYEKESSQTSGFVGVSSKGYVFNVSTERN